MACYNGFIYFTVELSFLNCLYVVFCYSESWRGQSVAYKITCENLDQDDFCRFSSWKCECASEEYDADQSIKKNKP